MTSTKLSSSRAAVPHSSGGNAKKEKLTNFQEDFKAFKSPKFALFFSWYFLSIEIEGNLERIAREMQWRSADGRQKMTQTHSLASMVFFVRWQKIPSIVSSNRNRSRASDTNFFYDSLEKSRILYVCTKAQSFVICVWFYHFPNLITANFRWISTITFI